MKKTVFLLGFLPNPRMYKRIALSRKYSDVHLVCWDRGKEMLESPEGRGISCDIIRITAGNDPVSRLIPYKKYAARAITVLKEKRPDIIHAQGLDMLQIACNYKKKHREVKIIYEVADLHRLLVDKQEDILHKVAQKYLLWQDRNLSKNVDLLIVTSQQYYDSYFSTFIPKEKVFYFPNVPDLSAFYNYKKIEHELFTVGYLGVIRYKNELRLLINAINKFGIKLIIAGYEESGNDIEEMCKTIDNIQWVGRFNFKEKAAELYGQCDIVYAVYDASMFNCQVALPNKLYEAVYCELPIMVADQTHVGEIVRDWNVGIPVHHSSQEEVDKAISDLMDKHIYEEYVKGCRAHKMDIDLEKYNAMLKQKVESIIS